MRARAFALTLACVGWAGEARADELSRTVDNAYPFTLPELSRERGSLMLDSTYATLSGATQPSRRGSIWLQSIRFEAPFYKTAWYVGGEYAFFSGLSAAGNERAAFLSGNTRGHVRGVWSTFDGLAFGTTFAVTLPTAEYDVPTGEKIAGQAITVAPHSINMLRPIDIGLAALVDSRLTLGIVTFQLRHGFEYGANPRVFADSQMAMVSTMFIGALVMRKLSLGTEGELLYLLDEGVPDTKRAAGVVRLGATWDLNNVSLGINLFTSAGLPLAREADSAWGGTLRLGWMWDTAPFRARIRRMTSVDALSSPQ